MARIVIYAAVPIFSRMMATVPGFPDPFTKTASRVTTENPKYSAASIFVSNEATLRVYAFFSSAVSFSLRLTRVFVVASIFCLYLVRNTFVFTFTFNGAVYRAAKLFAASKPAFRTTTQNCKLPTLAMTALFFNNCNPHLTDIALGYIPALGSSIGLMALDTCLRLWGTPAGRLSILCSHCFKELVTFVFCFVLTNVVIISILLLFFCTYLFVL